MNESLVQKKEVLQGILRSHAPLLIAYSGGVDSAYLLAEAVETLGAGQILGVIADSPSLPRRALREALELARKLGAPVEVVATRELENQNYAENPRNRCYFCKAALFSELENLAAQRSFRALAYGENADDMRQVRPGRLAASEFSVLAPLRDAQLSKDDIRALSRDMGLPTAEVPAQPCLSSRIPHGTPVTTEALAMVESGEEWVRSLGFRVFRVRHVPREDGQLLAKVQIAPEEMDRINAVQWKLEEGLKAVGYAEVQLDPVGYRAS